MRNFSNKKAVKIRNRQQFLFVRHNIYGLLGDKSFWGWNKLSDGTNFSYQNISVLFIHVVLHKHRMITLAIFGIEKGHRC